MKIIIGLRHIIATTSNHFRLPGFVERATLTFIGWYNRVNGRVGTINVLYSRDYNYKSSKQAR